MRIKFTVVLLSLAALCASVLCAAWKMDWNVIAWASVGQSGPLFPRHEPLGRGVGAMPGRVVWAHDEKCVSWDGRGYWWKPEHFSEAALQRMTDDGVAALAGKKDAKAGWEALFRAHNNARGKDGGYQKGQKIAIKCNINGAGAYGDDRKGETKESYTNPVLLRTLLISLVKEAGAAPADITVYDAGRIFPDYMVKLCTSGVLRGVDFRFRAPGGPNDAKPDLKAPVVWSRKIDGARNYLPLCVTQANYLINLANLKGHVYGMTLCAKNHFGSILNPDRMRAPQAAGLHAYVSGSRMGDYSPLVDLTANYALGGKTVLYMLDGVIAAPGESVAVTGENSRWQQPPFNGGYAASVLFSQDPVAIDSVGADFLSNEPTVLKYDPALRGNPGAENYLHEAAQAGHAPSGTVYKDGRGQIVTNLGVHEHWNNTAEKKYSRNLGKKEGIELVRIEE